MANTQVLTLRFGVTVINPLGQAIDLLRRDVERLRRQAEGTRLGRLVGEVIRLGLELGKVRQVERELALDQAQQNEEQMARLAGEIDEVERLRQHYLRLDQVIARLARLAPLPAQAGPQAQVGLLSPLLPVTTATTQQGPAATSPEAASAPPEPASRTRRSTADSVRVVTSVLGAGVIVGGSTAYKVSRQLPAENRQRALGAVRERGQAGAVNAFASAGKAWLEADTAEDKAKGVGAATGELGGSLLGAALGAAFSKNKKVEEYASMAGGYIGEWAGEWLGGKLFDFALYEDTPDPKAQSSAPDTAVHAGAGDAESSQQVEQDQRTETVQTAVTEVPSRSALSLASAPMVLQAATAVAPAALEQAGPSLGFAPVPPTLSQVGTGYRALAKGLFRRVPGGALLDATLQVADTYGSDASPAEKMQGYASAVGGLGGTMAGAAAGAAIGSVVPVIGTALGGLIGGALGSMGGESLGGWLGITLGRADGKDANPGSKDAAWVPGPALAAPAVSAAPGVVAAVTPAISTARGSPQTGSTSVTRRFDEHTASHATAKPPTTLGDVARKMDVAATQLPSPVPATPSTAAPPAPINQQFTFTANMPVTVTNSLDDPTTLQQLEAIARRVLDDLMRQARSVQMADPPHP